VKANLNLYNQKVPVKSLNPSKSFLSPPPPLHTKSHIVAINILANQNSLKVPAWKNTNLKAAVAVIAAVTAKRNALVQSMAAEAVKKEVVAIRKAAEAKKAVEVARRLVIVVALKNQAEKKIKVLVTAVAIRRDTDITRKEAEAKRRTTR